MGAGAAKETVAVERVECDSPDVNVEAVDVEGISPGRAYRVTQRVTKLGDQSSTLRFVIRRPGQPPRPVTVEVCYRGSPSESKEPPIGGSQP